MRIAINTRFLIPGKLEGLGWYTYEICRRLVQNHPEHTFYFLFDRPYSDAFLFGENVVPIHIPPPARHPILWKIWFEYSLPLTLRRLKADLFFSPDGYCPPTTTPTLLTVHDLAYLHYPDQIPPAVRRYYQKYTPLFLQRAHRIVAISKFVQRDIANFFPQVADRIHVVGNGPRGGFHPLTAREIQATRIQFSDGQPYFFYLGALHPRKNLPRLIQAFSLFKKQTAAPAKLLIGGRMAWQTGDIMQAWNQSEHKDDIRFLGYLPDDTLSRILGAAFALSYPSLFEGFGLPILEAFHCDIPVITSNTSSMPEVAGHAALFVNPMDTDSISAQLRQLWEHPALAAELIEKGRQQRAQFTWEKAADLLYDHLIALAKKAPAGINR